MKLIVIILALTVASMANASSCDFKMQKTLLAKTMYYEARGEGLEGMQAVGEIVLNRSHSDNFPDTVCEVVKQKNQFTWYKLHKGEHINTDDENWHKAKEIADDLLNHSTDVMFSKKTTYFYNPKVNNIKPKWVKAMNYQKKIGDHVFYAEK